MENILQVSDLKKAYGGITAVDGVSFCIYKGEMFAVLGPNGAGKSTTVNILSTSMPQDSGSAAIDGLTLGRHNRKIRKKIGVVFQKGVLDEMLTVEENLSMRGSLYGLRGGKLRERIAQIGEMTGTDQLMKRRYGSLSGGQQRRCDIARALVHLPKLLFLDEPAVGLDPEMRAALWETIDEIRAQTCMTVLLTTHYMDEAEKADRIMIMKKGRIAALGTPETLRQQFVNDRLILFSSDTSSLVSLLKLRGVVFSCIDRSVEITLTTTLEALHILELCRGRYSSFEVVKGSMESAYISIVERGGVHG